MACHARSTPPVPATTTSSDRTAWPVRVVLGLVILVALAGFVKVGYVLAVRFVLHGPVTPATLHDAVQRESGSAGGILVDKSRCQSTNAARTWSCVVADRAGSGGVEYRVRVRSDSSCFDGRITANFGEGGTEPQISGCVYRARWKLVDLL